MPESGPSTVGRYELHSRLGAGGMGTVWRAWDPSLRRDVAVKEVLLPSGMSPEEQTEAYERTLREAQATARINHTSVVTIHDVLEHGDSPWIVMELLDGQSLQAHLEQHGPLPPAQVEEAARDLLSGLKAAHAAGVTHRDVKPANIMLTEEGRTVLTDFGIANVDGSTVLTQTGVYIGSPEYMAPERFEGARALPASDLWSLGVTLYALLEGRSPFKRDSITGIISAVLTSPMPPRPLTEEGPRATESAPIRALISALLTRDVERRPDPDQALELLEREREAVRGSADSAPTAPPPGAGTPGGGAVGPPGNPGNPGNPGSPGNPGAGTPAVGTPVVGTPAAGTPAPSGMTPPVPPGTNTPHPTFAPSRPLQHPTHSGPQHPTHSGPQPSGVTGRYTSPPPGSPASGPPGGPGGITGYTTTAHPQPPQPPVGPAPHTQRFTHPHGGTGRGNTQQNPWSSRALPNMPKPVPVVIAAIMLGINALYHELRPLGDGVHIAEGVPEAAGLPVLPGGQCGRDNRFGHMATSEPCHARERSGKLRLTWPAPGRPMVSGACRLSVRPGSQQETKRRFIPRNTNFIPATLRPYSQTPVCTGRTRRKKSLDRPVGTELWTEHGTRERPEEERGRSPPKG